MLELWQQTVRLTTGYVGLKNVEKKETLVIKGFHILYFKLKMRKMGLEPTRGNPHKNLNLARLPFRHFRTTFIIVKVKTVLVN